MCEKSFQLTICDTTGVTAGPTDKETAVHSSCAQRLSDLFRNPLNIESAAMMANGDKETGNHPDDRASRDSDCPCNESDDCHSAESYLLLAEKYSELESRFQELQKTSYRIAHDLKAPLRAIIGFSNCIMEETGAELDDQCKNHLDRICTASKRMEHMFEGILKLARIDLLDIYKETVNLSELVTEFSLECEIRDPQRHVEFKIEKNIKVMGDIAMLSSLIHNLLENAWKYTGKEAYAVIEFGSEWRNEKQFYFIRDNGVGFDTSCAQHIFDAFRRLHRHDEFPGLGLGLTTARRIVELHGGTIRADAEVGKGTTIWFSLPARKTV